jgi:hypothetical protein
VEDPVYRDLDIFVAVLGDGAAGVGVAVEAREVAAGDLEADPVPGRNTLDVTDRSMVTSRRWPA